MDGVEEGSRNTKDRREAPVFCISNATIKRGYPTFNRGIHDVEIKRNPSKQLGFPERIYLDR